MYKYLFKGKIHPERVKFTIGTEIPIRIDHHGFRISGITILKIENSAILVSFSSNVKYSLSKSSELETLRNILEDVVRMIVDIYCYVRSYGYDVEIERIQCPEIDLDYQFGVRGEWNIHKEDLIANEEFSRILNLFTVSDNQFFSNVFADFRRAIKYPSMTASFCFRAIETIRQNIFEDKSEIDDNKRRDDGWVKLREKLNFKRDDFIEINKFALPNRHGQYPKITYAERERIMNFTRRVIDALIDTIGR